MLPCTLNLFQLLNKLNGLVKVLLRANLVGRRAHILFVIRNQLAEGAVVGLRVQSHLLSAHVQSLHLLVVALVYILFVISAHEIYG